jgi:probable rRNA maturation factor
MIDLDNQTTLPVDIDALEKIAESLSTNDVELVITDDTTMRELNAEYRDKDSITDVLSFPLESPFTEQSVFDIPLGSIIIAESFVKAKAEEHGHSIQDELSLLFIHGMLHLLGFDHETDDGEMREREKELIEAFDLPKSLIVRTDEPSV